MEHDFSKNSALIPADHFAEFEKFLSQQQLVSNQTQVNHTDSDSDDDENENEHLSRERNRNSTVVNRTRSNSKQKKKANQKPIKHSHLPLLDVKSISHESALLFSGKRKSGKTIAIVSFVLALSLPRVILFGKGRDSKFWRNYMNMIYIYEEWDPVQFTKIIKIQEALLKLKEKPGFEHLNIELAFILEDFSSDKQVVGGKGDHRSY